MTTIYIATSTWAWGKGYSVAQAIAGLLESSERPGRITIHVFEDADRARWEHYSCNDLGVVRPLDTPPPRTVVIEAAARRNDVFQRFIEAVRLIEDEVEGR